MFEKNYFFGTLSLFIVTFVKQLLQKGYNLYRVCNKKL